MIYKIAAIICFVLIGILALIDEIVYDENNTTIAFVVIILCIIGWIFLFL